MNRSETLSKSKDNSHTCSAVSTASHYGRVRSLQMCISNFSRLLIEAVAKPKNWMSMKRIERHCTKETFRTWITRSCLQGNIVPPREHTYHHRTSKDVVVIESEKLCSQKNYQYCKSEELLVGTFNSEPSMLFSLESLPKLNNFWMVFWFCLRVT